MNRLRVHCVATRRILSAALCGVLLSPTHPALAHGAWLSGANRDASEVLDTVARGAARAASLESVQESVPSVKAPRPKNAREREALHIIDLGDNAASENKHTAAIRYYEQALAAIVDSPYWGDVANNLRLKLSITHERWYRVVEDDEDLRKALVYAQGYRSGLGTGPNIDDAQARVDRLRAELEALEGPVPETEPEPKPSLQPGQPEKVIETPKPIILESTGRKERALRAGIIASGALGWLGLAGVGASYTMYAMRYDQFFEHYVRRRDDPKSETEAIVLKYRRHRNAWRRATVISGGVTAVSFATASILLMILANTKAKKRSSKRKKATPNRKVARRGFLSWSF